MLSSALPLVLLLQSAAPAPKPDCSYDLDAMLALDQQAFDQDMDGGWRPLGQRDGCEAAAAELIREWRHAKRAHGSILYWHEGQMRAFAGQTEQAIALFNLTYTAPEEDADFGWNHYVSGSIAFLTRDRERLARSIEALKTVPEPEETSFTTPDGVVIQMDWPPNLNVLEAFDHCWEKTYREAYGTPECAAPEGDT